MMRDPSPAHVYHDDTGTPMLRPGVSRIPLIVVWPGRIPPGLRIDEPVSMIDVLPTVLDFAELPMPEIMMGQSLAPLILGTPGWEPRPVILDAFEVNDQGELSGRIEVVDGRWGASLLINPDPEVPESRRRPSPILVFDLWDDPDCLDSIHDRRPDLVDRYTRFLTERFEIHKALASRFTRADDSPLTPEQLEALRSLGYIQ
jgi:arylsulfatase A-like enzyme